MLEPQSDTDSGAYGAPLSWADSVKLHAATTLAICGALEARGRDQSEPNISDLGQAGRARRYRALGLYRSSLGRGACGMPAG